MGVFGNNIITSDGDHWARQRKAVATVINERVSKAVFNDTVTQTKGLLEELSARQGSSSAAETNQLFNMAKKVAINVLSAAGMGTQVPWEDSTDEIPKPGFKQTYIQSVKKVINSVGGPIIIPIWLLRSYPSFLPGYDFLSNLGVAKTEFPIHTKDLLEKERIRSKTEGSATKSNVLSQLIQASDHPMEGNEKALKDSSGVALSDEELVGNLFIFTAAGFDTTANTISYALILLARYPQWQDWLLEEIDAIVPASPDAELDYVAIFPKATRLMAFLLETLRHFTPLVHISKQTQKPQTISTSKGNFWLPAKTTVYVNSIALHGDPGLWRGLNAPPNEALAAEDEWSFRPTRFLNPPGSAQPLFQAPRGAFVPWSAGPRVCPGQKMAQVEFTAMFVTLLRGHRVEAVVLEGETRGMVEERLERTMRASVSVLTVTMTGVYDVKEGDGKGCRLALTRRK